LGGFPEQCLIEVYNLFRFVIEKVYLRADNANFIEQGEKQLPRFWCSEIAAVLPEPYTNFILSGIINQFTHLVFAPFLPEAFNHVIFKSQLTCQTGEVLHLVQRILAPIEIFPNRATRFYPGCIHSLWKEIFVRRWRDIMNDVAVDQHIQVSTYHYH